MNVPFSLNLSQSFFLIVFTRFLSNTLNVQVSKQCMEMVAEGVLSPSKNLGCCAVSPTFTAIVEGKEAKEVRVYSTLLYFYRTFLTYLCALVLSGGYEFLPFDHAHRAV